MKQNKTRQDLDQVKARLFETVKEKYAIVNDSYTQDYAITFENITEKDSVLSAKAVVEQLVDLNDGDVIRSKFEYNLNVDKKTNIFETNEIKEILPKATTEDYELQKKLKEQNEVNGTLKGNSLGQSDEEWAKLREQKINGQKNTSKIDYNKERKELLKDPRPGLKVKRIELENAKKSINCGGIKVSAGLGGNPLNRSAVANYAWWIWWQRSSSYANFDLDNLGGDCTNYVSQLMQAGGYGNDAEFYSERTDQRYYGQIGHNTYRNNNGQRFYTSPSFRGVTANKQYIKNRWYTSDYYYYKNFLASNPWSTYYSGYGSMWASMFNGVGVGDVVYADWENDGLWDHSMIITNTYLSGGNKYPILTYHSNDWYDRRFDGFSSNANFVAMKLDQ